jgi:hypothetical protein
MFAVTAYSNSCNKRYTRSMRVLLSLLLLAIAVSLGAQTPAPSAIAGHVAKFDSHGVLLPWTSWKNALALEMRLYQQCPREHGYPRFVSNTFLDGDWNPLPDRTDTIPSTQNGMGIISYLKYYEFTGRRDAATLATARSMGDYLVKESLTPDTGKYPSFTRSTGRRGMSPQPPDSGSQSDHPYEIEPDKGGVAGYALLRLYEATNQPSYLAQSLHNARVLAVNQQLGDATHSPWPFRADYRTGEPRGPVSSNMTYILRLYDALLRHGYKEFAPQRAALWQWIKTYQIPSAQGKGELFAQFFEDHDNPANRNAWAPLNLARYLLEPKDSLDKDWLSNAGTLIEFVRKNFTHNEFGVTVCHEQDEDHDAWGGINSTYGAVLALYAKARQSGKAAANAKAADALASEARQALNFTLYSIDEQGRPRDLFKSPNLGGWQEDAHTDVLHNYLDAIHAFPDWAN